MLQPFRLDLAADRWVACIRVLPFVNADFTSAAYALQVRAVKDVAGTPLADLTTQTTGAAEGVRTIDVTTATIAAHIAAGRLEQVPGGRNPATGEDYASADSVTVTRVGIRINEATMEAMPAAAEAGDDLDLEWDLHITPNGGIKDKYVGGTFTVRSGATL